jgi:triosephosphate isomerase
MKYIIGNWKCHKTRSEIAEWAKIWQIKSSSFPTELKAEIQVVVCPTLLGMPQLKQLLPDLTLGAQGLSPFGDGAYTGAVSARLASEYSDFALLGHVERRKNFGETDQQVALQAMQALSFEMTPIVAVSDANWASQLNQFDFDQLKQLLVMYEPPEAISQNGQGHPADVDQVVTAIEKIQANYKLKGVLYGGSVNSKNVKAYLSQSAIMGVVPGVASLDASAFGDLIMAAY